jgi:hypothetical protein
MVSVLSGLMVRVGFLSQHVPYLPQLASVYQRIRLPRPNQPRWIITDFSRHKRAQRTQRKSFSVAGEEKVAKPDEVNRWMNAD